MYDVSILIIDVKKIKKYFLPTAERKTSVKMRKVIIVISLFFLNIIITDMANN